MGQRQLADLQQVPHHFFAGLEYLRRDQPNVRFTSLNDNAGFLSFQRSSSFSLPFSYFSSAFICIPSPLRNFPILIFGCAMVLRAPLLVRTSSSKDTGPPLSHFHALSSWRCDSCVQGGPSLIFYFSANGSLYLHDSAHPAYLTG